MAPGVPATLLNHAAGLSRIRARQFLAGVSIGGAPRALGYSFLGAGLADPSTGSPALAVVLVVLPSLVAVAVGLSIRRAPAGPGAVG